MPAYVVILIAAATLGSTAPPRTVPLDRVVAVPSDTQMAKAPETLTGKATWYDYHQGQAAAGSELRDFLGPHWRGQRVRACHQGACVDLTITDWCLCRGARVIDLDDEDFNHLSDTSVGVIRITISR